MILSNQKSLFSIPAEVTFLNCSYMSPTLNEATQAGINSIHHRGLPWQLTNDDWFGAPERLRSLFAQIINSKADNIALVPSASYGIAIAAKNISLTPQQTILILDKQFPSNVYAWRDLSKRSGAKIVTVTKKEDQSWTEAIIENINSSTGLVAVPNCHWTDGSLIDLEEVSAHVKKANAKLVIDVSQSAGIYPFDVDTIKPDFLVSVAYKWLLGPYNIAFLYASDEYNKDGSPIEFVNMNKAGSEDFSKLVYIDEYKPGARRFDAGQFSSFINVSMATTGLSQILKWGVENMQQTVSVLTDDIEQRARAAGFKTTERPHRVGHIVAIKFAEEEVPVVSKKLSDENIHISFRGTNMRISPHLYNDSEDVDKLFACIKK